MTNFAKSFHSLGQRSQDRHRARRFLGGVTLALRVAAIFLIGQGARAAEDTSIDKLLSKLPPPEKLVKSRIVRETKKADPAQNDPLTKKVEAAFMSGNNASAMSDARSLAQRNPRSAFAQFLHGAIAMNTQQWNEAAAAFRSSNAVENNHPIVHLALGVVEMTQHHWAAAITSLQESSRLQPSSAMGWALASQCAAELGRRQESLELARHATTAEPGWALAWIQRARAEKLSGNAAGTLQAVTRAAELSPDNADLSAVVGFSYINLNQIPKAIPPLERAARLAPQDYLVQSQLGFSLMAVGQVDAGISHLRKGASLKSDYGPVWEHLGLAYQKKGNHAEAIKAFERATQIMPNAPLPWQHLAQEYSAVGRSADAIRAASHAGPSSRTATAKKKN